MTTPLPLHLWIIREKLRQGMHNYLTPWEMGQDWTGIDGPNGEPYDPPWKQESEGSE